MVSAFFSAACSAALWAGSGGVQRGRQGGGQAKKEKKL